MVIGLLLAALVGFVAGGLFCAFVVKPAAIRKVSGATSDLVAPRGPEVVKPGAERLADPSAAPTMFDTSAAPAEGGEARLELATLRQTWQKRRHDVRGALSPALLTADRLTSHEDEQVRRAGEVVVLSLQRAIDALADPAPQP